jgi:hypothetical protein
VPSEPTDEQVNAAVKIVKKLKLKNYDVEQFENPALQAHFRMIESLALFKTDEEEICDTTMPGIYESDMKKNVKLQHFYEKNLLFRSSTVKTRFKKDLNLQIHRQKTFFVDSFVSRFISQMFLKSNIT